MRVLLDTNCLVAAASAQHEHHRVTITDLSRRRAAANALTVLEHNWRQNETIALTAAETWRHLRELSAMGVAGGRIYDGCIAAAARKAKCEEILTWNVRHFAGLPGARAVAPAESR